MLSGKRGARKVGISRPPGAFWTLGMATLGLFGLSVAIALVNQPEFTGDLEIYRDRMANLFAGGIPYVDFGFEHLPLTAAPMALAWVLGGWANPGMYTALFALLMGACLMTTTALLVRIEALTGSDGIAVRWIAMSSFLFPIVLFRSDPFAVVLAVAALWSIAQGLEDRAFKFELAAVFAKGWPVIYAVPEWSRGRRGRALLLVAVTTALVAVLAWSPGFSETRTFTGLHSESVVGSFFIIMRKLGGQPLELLYEAGATYVSVPIWGWLLNANIGVAVGLVAFARGRRVSAFDDIPRIVAASLLALMMMSPLLSPQFLVWAVPFVVFFRSGTVFTWGMWVTGLTLVYMIGWNPDFVGESWWIYILNVRNVALIVLGGLCAWSLGAQSEASRIEEPAHA